jgi:TPR repeat protein
MSSIYDRALKAALKAKQPTKKVYEMLVSAASGGDARAAYALATWHLHGTKFIKKDLRRGTNMLEQAASGNVPDACYDLAVSYEKGIIVKQSKRKAFEFYTRAALFGEHQSVYEVGRMYYHGIGTRKNLRLAEVWLSRAETLGISD